MYASFACRVRDEAVLRTALPTAGGLPLVVGRLASLVMTAERLAGDGPELLRPYGFLLNSASQAERASPGVTTARLPVRSKVLAGA